MEDPIVLRIPQKLDVNVRSQPHVISQVPARVIRIFVNHNLIGIPEPPVAVSDIGGRHAEVKTIEPEAAGTAARQVPYVAWPEAAGKVPMFEGMVQMISGVIRPGIVAYPFIACVHVGSVRMAGFFIEMLHLALSGSLGRRSVNRRGAFGGNMSAVEGGAFFLFSLAERRQGKRETEYQQTAGRERHGRPARDRNETKRQCFVSHHPPIILRCRKLRDGIVIFPCANRYESAVYNQGV